MQCGPRSFMSAPPGPQATSRSAAKKKAKKAAKAAQVTEPVQSGESDPLDPNFLPSFPPGAYPVEYAYNSATYYDVGEVVTANGTTNAPFTLPFPFTYPPALQQQQQQQPGQQLQPQQQLANGVGGAVSVPNNINHEDLIRVANELYKRMGDPNFAADDQYWTSLPAHLRHFIRDVLPTENNKPSEAPRSLYSMAQQIVNAASQGMGLGLGVGQNLMAQMNGRQPYPPQSIGEELGFRPHPNARDDELDDEDDFDLDEPEYAAPNGDAPKKKNKKKKKKSSAAAAAAAAAATTADPPPLPLAVKQPPRQPVPSQPVHQPALNPPPPPAAPIPAHTPSSRAAGKQPMTTTAPAPTSNPPARSARAAGKAPASSAPVHNHAHHTHAPPTKPTTKGKAPANPPPAKIWTQSSKQDRDNIRSFWLGLNEAERRDLLQIEKDAVLRKMKEQHRNSCGCAVCGRKKVNIEMELDQLYEQYYDELRSYAAEQRAVERGHPPPPGAGPFPGSVEVDASGQVTQYDHRAPDPHDHDDLVDDGSEGEYDDEEEYDDEDDLEDEDLGSEDADADELDDAPPPPRPVKPVPKKNLAPRPEGADDFMSFGSSLATIKGGILTVADDLLKNDGAKFLEMMEQLAVARSSREEQNYRDLQEETDEEDEDEPIPEAERVEEGKRMFQIFAARMFEQRVLHAYREKMSTHKQEAFLRELEDEDEARRIAAEKKAKDAQKKKDKKKQQKQKAEEEKAAREAAAAAEILAAKAKAEEAERERQKKLEEERARREAQKKAVLEEQQRQAAERKKRQQEEKEREEDAARKKREREEKARKEREAREKEIKDREKREREEKAAKEKAEKERVTREKEEKERLANEAREKAESERLAKLEEERLEKARKDEAARKAREAEEQAKILAAQQAQRERAKAEKLAAEKLAAAKAEAAKAAARAKTTPRNGSTPTGSSPAEPAPRPSSSQIRPQKTPQPYYPQPIPTVAAFPQRMPAPPAFAPGYRPPGFAAQAFSPPAQSNGQSVISPNPLPRSYAPDPSPPFAEMPRTAPIGIGYPTKPRGPSMDETFSPPTAPIGSIGANGSRNVSQEYDEPVYRRPSEMTAPAPIAPPTNPIGRPGLRDPSSSSARPASPPLPDQVFGSAALSAADDEIVKPARRTTSNGWTDLLGAPPPVAPIGVGAGVSGGSATSRWSAAPASIWSNSVPGDPIGVAPSPWGASPVSAPGRQPSYGFGAPGQLPPAHGHGHAHGLQHGQGYPSMGGLFGQPQSGHHH